MIDLLNDQVSLTGLISIIAKFFSEFLQAGYLLELF